MFFITFGILFFSKIFPILNTRGDPCKKFEFQAKNFLSSQTYTNIITGYFCPDKAIPVVKNCPKSKIKALQNDLCSKIVELTIQSKFILSESQPETSTAWSNSMFGSKFT